jgi:hypothetical protein
VSTTFSTPKESHPVAGQGKEKGFLQTTVRTTQETLSVFIVRVKYVMHKRSSVDRAQDVHQHDTHHKTDLYLPCHRLTKSIKQFEYLSLKFYNAIERTVREQPTKVFLAIVKNFLIYNPLYDYT